MGGKSKKGEGTIKPPARKKAGSYHREYNADVAPLAAFGGGNGGNSYHIAPGLNEEEDVGSSSYYDRSQNQNNNRYHNNSSSTPSSPPPPCVHTLSMTGLICSHLCLFAGGAGAIGFLLYYHTFFLTLWWSMFTSGCLVGVTMMVYSVFGIVQLLLHRNAMTAASRTTRMLPYAILAMSVIAAIVATETLYLLAWNTLQDPTNRDNLGGTFLSKHWAASVLSGGSEESSVCSIQHMFSCEGWHGGCGSNSTTISAELSEMLEAVAAAAAAAHQETAYPSNNNNSNFSGSSNHASSELLPAAVSAALMKPMLNHDDYRTTAYLLDWLANYSQLGNCPLCYPMNPSSNSSSDDDGGSGGGGGVPEMYSCAVAIGNKLDEAVWYVLGGGIGIVALVVINMLWAVKSREFKRRAQITADLLDAQRYL